MHLVSPLTTYMVPKPEEVNLLTGESATQVSVGGRARGFECGSAFAAGQTLESEAVSCYSNNFQLSACSGLQMSFMAEQ